MTPFLQNLNFPELPENQASWAPLLWTPVLGSEERFMIGVVAEYKEKVTVHQILPNKILKVLYPRKNQEARSIIDFVIDVLNKQEVSEIDSLVHPISGISTGRKYRTFCDDLEDLIEQAIMDQSSLISPEEYRRISNIETKNKVQPLQKFRREVKNIVTSKNSNLENFFEKDLFYQNFSIRYDFLSPNFVCQFGILKEESKGDNINSLKQRLFDLNLCEKNKKRCVIADCPASISYENAVYSMAKTMDVSFFKANSSQDAADILLEELKAA